MKKLSQRPNKFVPLALTVALVCICWASGATSSWAQALPTMTSPTPGSTFPGSTVTFNWTAGGAGVTGKWLYVGSSLGASDLHDSGYLGTLSTTVNGLPLNGQLVHVRLWYVLNGTWEFTDYQYTAATGSPPPTPPGMTSPTPGSTLPGSTVTFTWTAGGSGITGKWLYVGSSLGASDLHDSGYLSTLSTTVNGLPENGQQIYVRLWYVSNGSWESTDYQYTAATSTSVPPEMTSPTPGSTLSGSIVTFNWTANTTPVTNWWVDIGSSLGAYDVYVGEDLTTLTSTIGGLPTDGRQLFVRLWHRNGQGPWEYVDVQYVAATGGGSSPALTSPTPWSTLAGSTATFAWEANGTAVTEWWLYVGSQTGSPDILDSGSLELNLSTFVVGLPTNGEAVHARLWYKVGGNWLYTDYQFTAATFVVVDYYVALGDSITFGFHHDNVPFDDVSYDGRNSGGGYPPVLNNLLTAVKNYGHTVENEGISGDQAIDGVNRIQDVLNDHPGSTHFLIQYGTNDSWFPLPTPSGLDLPCTGLNMPNNHPDCPGSFKDNMLRIIQAVEGAGKKALLAKVPMRYGNCGYYPQCNPYPDPNSAPENAVIITTFNQVIDQLILEESLEVEPGTLLEAPDFYTYFQGTGVDANGKSPEFDDFLHPDGYGMRSMAELWCNALTDSDPLCVLP